MIAETLKSDTEAYVAEMRHSRLLRLARQGQVSPATVATYLGNLHYLLQHTPLLLSLATKRAAALDRRELSAWLVRKAREEEGHYRWAEDDLAALSHRFRASPVPPTPLPPVAELVAAMQRKVEDDPVHLLAYGVFAEYSTVLLGPDWLEALDQHCGIPPGCMTAVARHVEIDRDHAAEGLRQVDALVPDLALLEPMRETVRYAMLHLASFYDTLADLEN